MNTNIQDLEQGEIKLTSDVYDDFKESLEVLYVLANISGRIKFAGAWPHAARYVLGDELLKYDREGVQDREHRSQLERAAEERRITLLSVLDTLEEKSVVYGALQMEYINALILEWGRDFALNIYSARIVDRFIAPPDIEAVPLDAQAAQGFGLRGPRTEVKHEFSVKIPDEALENVRPIAVKAPMSIEITQDTKPEEEQEAVSITFMAAKPSPPAGAKTETTPEPEEKKE